MAMVSDLLIIMCRRTKLLLITLLCLRQAGLTITLRKFLYQKDMSEHCRRRVLPSVFLGRNVADAHSQMLHFSSLELPYSCFISVRAESGSSIILVIQFLSREGLVNACSERPNQFLVYEMGETFGGYWGALPENIMRSSSKDPSDGGQYFIEATEAAEPASSETHNTEEFQDYDTTTSTDAFDTYSLDKDYITIELPILNVSLDHFVPPGKHNFKAVNDEDVFDVANDVTPRPDILYEKSLKPGAQFSTAKIEKSRRLGSEQRYDLQFDGNLDRPYVQRMKWHPITKTYKHNKWKTTRNINNKQMIYSNKNIMPYFQEYLHFTQSLSNNTTTDTLSRWHEIINTWMRLDESSTQINTREIYDDHIRNILYNMSNSNYNYSVYLYPNLSKVKDTVSLGNNTRFNAPSSSIADQYLDATERHGVNVLNSTTNKKMNVSTDAKISTSTIVIEEKASESVTTIKNDIDLNVIPSETTHVYNTVGNDLTFKQYDLKLNILERTTAAAETVTSRSSIVGLMVGRESWENVVRAAPVMAELLNLTVAGSRKPTNNSEDQPTAARRKRTIQPIPIENARPHTMASKAVIASTEQPLSNFNIQDFAHLIELQDDGIQDRVALRFLRQYVGATIFNICDYTQPQARHAYLLNSSRIVIAINNFTLQSMTVILTPARMLFGDSDFCSKSSLECQLNGARVCIDNSTACDGVPNCGAYDIYDEDRLKCGAAEGLQHNVYLAAFAFVAVLLTLLYSIHYWLKRCIPKVSEAFFIYTDTADNILNLETIMRPPNDTDSDTKDVFLRDSYDDDDSVRQENVNISKQNIFIRSWIACLNFITCKIKQNKNKPLRLNLDDNYNKILKSRYSFTQMELNKIAKKKDEKHVSVQTGSSLEMSEIKRDNRLLIQSKQKRYEQNKDSYNIPVINTEDTVKKNSDELSILKFCKETRLDSLQSNNGNVTGVSGNNSDGQKNDEKELKIHVYENYIDKNTADSQADNSNNIIKFHSEMDPQKPTSTRRLTKHLRFNEKIATIPTIKEGTNKDNDKRSTIAVNVEDTESGISKDFKRLWGVKNKKSKKNTHVTLR